MRQNDPLEGKPMVDPIGDAFRWAVREFPLFKRQNLIIILFLVLILLQFLTLRAIHDIRLYIPDNCGSRLTPCHINADEVARAIAKELRK